MTTAARRYSSPSNTAFHLLRTTQTPRCTLFPYTTLFRSPFAVAAADRADRGPRLCLAPSWASWRGYAPRDCGTRSEEHTSELQSQSNLVCRLLLEKKNSAGQRIAVMISAKLLDADATAPL